jgi:putative peptide zinc metalloprotease protein
MSLTLRQDLELRPVDPDHDGTPAYVLHDPVAGRYYRLSSVDVELLRGPLAPPADAAARASAALGRPVAAETVQRVAAFLRQHDLAVASGPSAQTALLTKAARMKGSWAQRVVRSYLFLKLPLFRPDAFLSRSFRLVGWLLSAGAAWGAVALGLVGAALIVHQWDAFIGSFLHFFSWQGLIAYGFVLFGVKAIHELAHAYTAKKHGARVFTMGIAFMVFWPVFYTDTTDSWRLAARRARLEIACAGIRIELMLACLAAFVWSFLPDGPMRSVAFMLASSTWILTLVVNLNPLMKFDGYFILADLLNTENLQERGVALATWRRRRALWGFRDPPPEPPRLWLLVYGVMVWAYRFVLTLSVALVVYAFVFKLLGLVLITLQLSLFVGLPLMRDLKVAVTRRAELRWPAVLRTGLVLAGLIAAAATPWAWPVDAPALLLHRAETLYAPVDGRIVEAPPLSGEPVAVGAVVIRLAAPDLDAALADAQREAETLRWQLSVLGFEGRIANRAQVIETELRTTLARQRSLEQQLERLVIRTSLGGVVGDRAPGLVVGSWIGAGDPLVTVVERGASTTVAYVGEDQIARIAVGAEGRFYPADGIRPPVRVRVAALDPLPMRDLDQPVLASTLGGPVPVRPGEEGRLVPIQGLYRIELTGADLVADGMVLGRVALEGPPQSLLGSVWRRTVGVARRELAF